MTTQNTTTTLQAPAISIAPIAIIYRVTKGTRSANVKVTNGFSYSCDCPAYALFQECEHISAVKTERNNQGRK